MKNRPEWLDYPESQTLFAAIENAGGVARFVGGCVRDAFFNKVSADLDVCTDMLPNDVMSALASADFKVFPTGLDHGTITAVLNDRKFEVTTLRLDVQNHGRRATVAFTKDFQEDAARRDFTFNALSMDITGKLYDYFQGLEDLKAGRVRFIGRPEERIAEDYLRILRFFRFFARFGRGVADKDAIKACEAARPNLTSLSLERVTMELRSLFSVSDPFDSLMLMEECGVRKTLLPGKIYKDRLKRALPFIDDPLIRLAVYFGADAEWVRQLPKYLRLSVRSQAFLEKICQEPLGADLDKRHLKRIAYWKGLDVVKTQCLILKAEASEEDTANKYLEYLDGWKPPAFDLKGRDMLSLGFPAGPAVGKILGKLEKEWVESDFTLPKSELLSKAKQLKP